jgi:DNA-binding IclR family transcriptional regulator
MSASMSSRNPKQPQPSPGTQLLDRAIAILRQLSEAGEGGIKSSEIIERLQLSGPTAHRIIAALERHGFVERERATKRLRLGLALFALGAKAADSTGLRRICRPALLRLAGETGDTVFLMARSGLNAVCVDRQEGTYILDSLTGHVGGQIPLGVGSASEAILAFLPEREVEAVLKANAHLYPAFNGLTADEILAALPQIRERGYAVDHGRLVVGISALAVPLRPPGRDVIAALTINMTSPRLSGDRLQSLVAMLQAEALDIQAQVNPIHFAAQTRGQ